MSLVPSLLQAIVHVDGEALVMHTGDKPYVVAPTGQIELANRGLTLDAVNGIVAELLPVEFQHALDEFDAVQYELPTQPDFPNEYFTVVAARGGSDVWIEIRRRRMPDEDHVPDDFFAAQTGGPVSPAATASASAAHVEDDAVALEEAPVIEVDDLSLPDAAHLWPGSRPSPAASEVDEDIPLRPVVTRPEPEPLVLETPIDVDVTREAPVSARLTPTPMPEAPPPSRPATAPVSARLTPTPLPEAPAPVRPASAPVLAASAPTPVAEVPKEAPAPRAARPAPKAAPPPPKVTATAPTISAPPPPTIIAPPLSEPPQAAVVLQMARNPVRADAAAPPLAGDTLSGLERLLRVAAARGASTLYLSSDDQPSVRVDGELQMIEGEPVLSSNDVVSLLLTLMPERSHEALRTGAATEWICDIEDVGRVRCMSFRDHHGPGGVFRLMPVRAVSADQLGLSREIQALAIEPEGLVLVAGPRSSGKRTLISAFVDLINRTRRDHVITIEREVSIVHPRSSSFVSQREVRGTDEEMLAAARAALREDPDVLVLEQVRNGGMMNVALEAAASGHLVIAGFAAHSATAAIDRIIDLYAPEYSRQVQLALADNLRGVIAQVLLKRNGGGRVAAREVLLNTSAVASVVAEGKTSQLPMAIEGGRRHGMVPLTDSLVGFVQNGTVDAREAYRHVTDRGAFLAHLKREGLDTSFVERLA